MTSESTDFVKQSLQEVIDPLTGKALWACTRAADLACFQFGERRAVTDVRGRKVNVGEYALHVQCAWRITRQDQVLVGNADLYYPPDLTSEEIPTDFEWDRGQNRRDELLRRLFDDGKRQYIVQSVHVGNAGAFFLSLEDAMSLDVVPNSSLLAEHWRLFRPRSDEPHFVFGGKGASRE
jgi:hypothetical protein